MAQRQQLVFTSVASYMWYNSCFIIHGLIFVGSYVEACLVGDLFTFADTKSLLFLLYSRSEVEIFTRLQYNERLNSKTLQMTQMTFFTLITVKCMEHIVNNIPPS